MHRVWLVGILCFVAAPVHADDRPILSGPLADLLDVADLTAPEGFDNPEVALQAILGGQVRMADLNPRIPRGIELRENIVYGRNGNSPLRLDLYSPEAGDEPRPAIILIHGGAWMGGSKSDYRVYGVAFAELGYVVASIDYRLVPSSRYPAQVEDCKCAVRWMRANAEELGIDPDRIAVFGGSAGGHLAMMVGYSSDVAELDGNGGHEDVSSEVSAVIALYGPATFTLPSVLENPQSCQLLEAFLGASYERNPELWETSSPIYHLDENDPPTLLLHGTIDEVVGIDQSDALVALMDELGQTYLYDRLPGWTHGMDMARDVNYRTLRLTDLFLTHVWDEE
jgi:acetyl esterase/lipase